jgi:hypothetical protein
MRFSFDILGTIIIRHEAFPLPDSETGGLKLNERVSDLLEIFPEDSTLSFFKQNNFIFKKIKNCYVILYQKTGPRISNLSNLEHKEIYYKIHIKDSSFYGCTDPGFLKNQNDQTIFYKPTDNGELLPEIRKTSSLDIIYSLTTQLRPVKIAVMTFRGEKVMDASIISPEIKSLEIDLRKRGAGAYRVQEEVPSFNYKQIFDIYSTSQNQNDSFYGSICQPFDHIPVPYKPISNTLKFKKKQ